MTGEPERSEDTSLIPAGADRALAKSSTDIVRRGLDLARTLDARDITARSQPRVVHFPEDHSSGTLYIRDRIDGHDEGDSWDRSDDERVIDWVIEEFKKDQGIDLRQSRIALQRLKDEAEKAKVELSTTPQAEINLPFITTDASGPRHMAMTLTRAKRQLLNWHYLGDARGVVMIQPDQDLKLASDRVDMALAALAPEDLQYLDTVDWSATPHTHVTDDDLAHLKHLTGLRILILHSTEVTGAGLAHLQRLTGLRHLHLSNTKVTDAGLGYLKGLTDLRYLGLGVTGITDAGLTHLKYLTSLTGLTLTYTRVTDAGLAHLRYLTSLRELYLDATQVTDAGLAHLQHLTSLTSLVLRDTRVTDAGLTYLQHLTRLTSLDLGGSGMWGALMMITDAGLIHLRHLTVLRKLNLDGTQVTDAGLAHLKHLTSLTSLDLGGTGITDAGLTHLQHLTRLRELRLDATQVSGAGLAPLKHLTGLYLVNTQVTDAGLAHLQHLTALRELDLRGTQVTDAGRVWLQTALPDVRIDWLSKT